MEKEARSVRWFLVRTEDTLFTFSSNNDTIVWIQDHVKEWLGKTLADIKVMILDKKGMVIELKPDHEQKFFKLDKFFNK